MPPKKTDHICGIDRYEHSETRGSLAVPVVYLWKRPGAALDPKYLTGAVEHGQEVEILDVTQHKGVLHYRVSAEIEHEGQTYLQVGWLPAVLLEERGLKVTGVKAVMA